MRASLLRSLRLAVLAAPFLLSTQAKADTHTILTSGNWEAFEGKTDSGVPVCGMDTVGTNQNDDDIDIKYYNNDTELTVQLFSNAWSITDGASNTKITLKFDNDSWNVGQVTGFHVSTGEPGMEFYINKNDVTDFLNDFANSSKITVNFTNSSVADWTGDLSGTTSVVHAFEECIRDLP